MRDRTRARHAAHHVDAETAENEARDSLRMLEREEGSDSRTHRVADHMRLRNREMVEQASRILGHERRPILGELVELFAFSVAPVVEGNDAIAPLREISDPR